MQASVQDAGQHEPYSVEESKRLLAQAQRQMAMTRDQLDYTTLVADAGGVITDLKLEVGQVVAMGARIGGIAT